MLAKVNQLRAKRIIRYTALVAALVSAILTPLIEFDSITVTWVKWIIYSVLVTSVLTISLPNLLNLIPEKARYRKLRETIVNGLDIVCSILSSENPASYHASIFMLPTPDSKALNIRYNSSNMNDALDRDVEFEKYQGCTGTAWAMGRPVVADLTIAPEEGGPQWGLTAEQIRLTQHLKAVLSVPIRDNSSGKIIGILSVDSDDDVAAHFLKPSTRELAASYASIFSSLLQAIDRPYPLS